MLSPTTTTKEEVPAEIWGHVFERLCKPKDLLNSALVCKEFKELALRSLYRDLIYREPIQFLNHLNSWNFSLLRAPNSLVLSISYLTDSSFSRYDPSIALVNQDGSITTAHDPNDPRPPHYFASISLYSRIIDHVSQFSLLTELVFHNAHLPPLVYSLIKNFPSLENLFFYDCFLPIKSKDLTALDILPTAPIQKLALWNIRNEGDPSTQTVKYALRLATIPSIRVLHVDWTHDSASYFNNLARGVLPPITDLSIRMPAQYAWPADLNTARTRLVDPLIVFLNTVPTIQRLSITNRLPLCSLHPHALPLLTTYSGPHTSVLDIATYRHLTHLEFRDDDKKSIDVITVLPDLKKVASGLESLSLPLRKWDEEIMYPTTDFFPKLRKLKIVYDEGHPSEYSILSLGARFLLKLPELHTFQLYNPLYSYAYPPPSPKPSSPSPTNATTPRPHFIAAYSNQPTSTNFEELAFPPSPTLHISHRLTRPMPTLHARRFVYVGSTATGAGVNNHHQHQHQHHNMNNGAGLLHPHHQTTLHAFLTQSSSPTLAPTSYKLPPANPISPPEFGTESTLGPQAGPTREVLGYLAAWRKHCKKLRRVQFVKDYMWRRLDEELPWTGIVVDEENAIKFGGGC